MKTLIPALAAVLMTAILASPIVYDETAGTPTLGALYEAPELA